MHLSPVFPKYNVSKSSIIMDYEESKTLISSGRLKYYIQNSNLDVYTIPINYTKIRDSQTHSQQLVNICLIHLLLIYNYH